MTKRNPLLGADCPIDVDKLIESKLLIQANSGAGKSWSIRRIAEQTYGKAQQIIIDHDGEYHTLREKYDYVLAGKNGDCPADIKSAAMLARRLLELRVSVIIDIYELGTQRAEFVRRFLEALVNAPRDLWHSVLVILDEAHLYCPEKGSAVSADAVKNLMALGRKRGFCGVLATQRIAKLNKDAAAECNNKLIGRSALDVDMKRAADELGFTTKDDIRSLRTLKAGEFYVFGPAFTDTVTQIQVGAVKTTHLRAGQRAARPVPPSTEVKKMLSKLADLPHEAEEEARSIAEWKAKTKALEAELRKAKTITAVEKIVEKPMIDKAHVKRIEAAVKQGEKVVASSVQLAEKASTFFKKGTELLVASNIKMEVELARLREALGWRDLIGKSKPIVLPVKQPKTAPPGLKITKAPQPARPARSMPPSNGSYDGAPLPVGEAAVLRAAIQYTDGLFKKQVTVLTGYKRSTRDAYISRLREKGLLTEQGDRIFATTEGIAALPDAEPLPSGEALRDWWMANPKFPTGEKQVLQVLIEAYPDAVAKPTIDEVTGFKRSTRDAYLSRLGAKELIVEVGRAEVQASPTLFEIDA